jgi:hypothetical protein
MGGARQRWTSLGRPRCIATRFYLILLVARTPTRALVVEADACSPSYLALVDVVNGLDKFVEREDGDFRFDKALQAR